MAQANSTPIQLYYSNTASNIPPADTLIPGEVGINIVDGKLYYLDEKNTTNLIASRAATAGQFPQIQFIDDATIQVTAAAPYAYSNASFLEANTASANTVVTQGVDARQNTDILSTGSYANAAFIKANSAYQHANQSFVAANNNLDSITLMQGVDARQNTNISDTLTFAGKAFDLANTNASILVNVAGIDARQNTNITAATVLAQGAFDLANTTISGEAWDDFARTRAEGAFTQANSSFTKANNAVANTSVITVADSLNVPGQANVTQRLAVGNGAF